MTTHDMSVDFGEVVGRIRPLHGVNRGPLSGWGLVDLSEPYRAAKIPSVRLHDCPVRMMEAVDLHFIFPDFLADVDDPANYRFTQTDDYIDAICRLGAEVVFRLGASIEHYRQKSHVHPPADFDRWSRIAVNIVRHYNNGWANGFQQRIRYWEIWNEPDIRPQCWTGTDAEFIRFYITAAKALKTADPSLKIGGPAYGYLWREKDEFLTAFLRTCAQQNAPLDFFSWHSYAAKPQVLCDGIHRARQMLDDHGFSRTENHLNEWNFLPEEDWGALFGPDYERRKKVVARQQGVEGAAFIAAALSLFQDTPLDMGNFYVGDILNWGLFEQCGASRPNYDAFRAFGAMLDTSVRVQTCGGDPAAGLTVCAGRNDVGTRAQILVTNFDGVADTFRLTLDHMPWPGTTRCEVHVLDSDRRLELVRVENWDGPSTALSVSLPAPSVALLKLSPGSEGTGAY